MVQIGQTLACGWFWSAVISRRRFGVGAAHLVARRTLDCSRVSNAWPGTATIPVSWSVAWLSLCI